MPSNLWIIVPNAVLELGICRVAEVRGTIEPNTVGHCPQNLPYTVNSSVKTPNPGKVSLRISLSVSRMAVQMIPAISEREDRWRMDGWAQDWLDGLLDIRSNFWQRNWRATSFSQPEWAFKNIKSSAAICPLRRSPPQKFTACASSHPTRSSPSPVSGISWGTQSDLVF